MGTSNSTNGLTIPSLFQMRRQDIQNLRDAVRSNDLSKAQTTLRKYQSTLGSATASPPASSSPVAANDSQAQLVETIIAGTTAALSPLAKALESTDFIQNSAVNDLAGLIETWFSGSPRQPSPGSTSMQYAQSAYSEA